MLIDASDEVITKAGNDDGHVVGVELHFITQTYVSVYGYLLSLLLFLFVGIEALLDLGGGEQILLLFLRRKASTGCSRAVFRRTPDRRQRTLRIEQL